ncbi:MAG: hypothetical protein ACOYOS_19805 [Syntrophales bacterium]
MIGNKQDENMETTEEKLKRTPFRPILLFHKALRAYIIRGAGL